MLIKELSKYGNITHQYIGKGRFRNSSSDCDFGAVQLSDSSIYLICEFKTSPAHIKCDLQQGDTPTFAGLTQDDRQIFLQGNLTVRLSNYSSAANSTIVTFIPLGGCYLGVGNKEFGENSEFRFNITNLIFMGTEIEQLSETEYRRNALKFQFDENEVRIRKVPDFKSVESKLDYQKNIEISCQLLIKYQNTSKIEDILQIAENTCGLFSIANGTLVSWISFEIYSSDGKQIYIEHQPNITNNYGSSNLIDSMPPELIESFVNSTYQNYRELKPLYDLASIVRVYSSIRLSSFIEIRSLTIASLVEFLLNKFSEYQPINDTLIDEKFFRNKKRKKELTQEIRRVLLSFFPSLKEEILSEVDKKINDFNRRSFNDKLQRFITHFCVPITAEEIADFVQTRNSLAHGFSFKADDTVQEYRKMVHFFDRLLLGMLSYKGNYVNFTKPSQWVGSNTDYFEPTC